MMRRPLAALVLACVFSALTLPSLAQNVQTGTWMISPSTNSGKIDLELHFQKASGSGNFQDSQAFTLESLGLQQADLTNASHPVHFTLRREAGSIDFTGTMGGGVGAGHFTFSPSPSYPNAIGALGIDRPSSEQQLTATLLDASTGYANSMIAAGARPSSFEKLIAFRALQMTPESVTSLQRAFGKMDEQSLITFTALHITPQYADQLKAEGLTDLDQHSLVTMKALQVDPAYIHDLASVGYDHLSAHDLTELKALHVDAQYIRLVEAHGYKHPTVEQLVQLKALKII